MIDFSLIFIGTAYSISNIETILGIIILSIQLIWIIYKFIIKGIQFIKKKISSKELEKTVIDTIETLDGIRKEVNSLNGINKKE